ncbi:MAG: GYD domain-containing protein [Actinobacteria bacterium]|nr:GYD domain-containing protein [Actinomycetota bacterium]
MPTFVYLGNYTALGLEGAMRDGFESRVTAVSDLLEAHGGQLVSMGFCMGEYDFVIVADIPSRKAALVAPMVAGSAGTVSVATIELISASEMSEIASMAKVSQFKTAGSGSN